MIRRNGLGKDIKAQCLQSLVEMFIADGNLDLEDQDHLKCVILNKIRSRSDQDHDLILKIKIVPISASALVKLNIHDFGQVTSFDLLLSVYPQYSQPKIHC